MQPVHRVLVLTDLVDSTRLVEGIGDARAVEVWLAHDRVARALLERHDGREIDRTDGFLLLFEQVEDAVAFADGYHAAMEALSADLSLPLRARVGVHAGPVVVIENPPEAVARGTKPYEVEGLAKPLAARIMSVARGGQTLVSASARAELRPVQASALVSHGFWRFKGLAEPLELFEAPRAGLAPQPPPADTEKVWRVLRQDDLWVPVRAVPHNLPAERDRFLAREAELATLAAELHGGARLVTVTGMGGTGKTRFVTRFAHQWLGEWPGGVWFGDLIEARGLEAICASLARALDVPLTEAEPVRQLGHALAARGATLVILDNFEQLVSHAGATVGRWLEMAPGASFVVTSRETLGIRGERVLPLAPLPLGGGQDSPAAALFVERARAARPDFRLTPQNAGDVARLVALLDGIPLAIELAAARAAVLTPAQLVDRMSDRFRLLVGKGTRGDRANTLRATIDASWELLGRAEQLGLAQLSVFPGAFRLEDAVAVLSLDELPDAPWPEDVLQSLVGRSLVRATAGADGEPSFSMLSVIQSYALEKLTSPEGVPGLTGPAARQDAEQRHGRWFARLGAPEALAALESDLGAWRTLGAVLDDLLVAARRAVVAGDGAIATPVTLAAAAALEQRGPLLTAITALEAALGRDDLPGEDATRLRLALGRVLRAAGRTGEAEAAYLSTLEEARSCGLRETAAAALEGLGAVRKRQGRLAEAESCLSEALSLARACHNAAREAGALVVLADLYFDRGDRREARALLEVALGIQRRRGDRHGEARTQGLLGRVLRGLGDSQEALVQTRAAIDLFRSLGDRQAEAVHRTNLGSLLRSMGRPDEASAHYTDALGASREIGVRVTEGALLGNLALLHQEQGRLDEATRCYQQALDVFAEVGPLAFRATVLGNLGNLHLTSLRGAEARQAYLQALEHHRALGTRSSEGFVQVNLGALLRIQGRLDEADDALRAALALHDAAADERMIGATQGEIAQVRLARGALEAAEGPLEDAIRRIRTAEDRRILAELLLVRARLERLRAQRPVARDTLAESLEAARAVGDRSTELGVRCEAARLALDEGDLPGARSALAEAAAVQTPPRSLGGATLLATRARVAAAAGEGAQAQAALATLRERLAGLDATPEAPLWREVAAIEALLPQP